MEVTVLSYVMLGFLMLAGAATLRLHKTTAFGKLANNQVLLFSMICTLFSGVLIVFWFYLFWLFVSIGYGLALVLLAWLLSASLKSIHYQSTVWALLLVGIVGTLLMQVLFFIDYYPLA